MLIKVKTALDGVPIYKVTPRFKGDKLMWKGYYYMDAHGSHVCVCVSAWVCIVWLCDCVCGWMRGRVGGWDCTVVARWG